MTEQQHAPDESPAEDPAERVRAQLSVLEAIAQRPLAEHVEQYGEVHAELQAALTEID